MTKLQYEPCLAQMTADQRTYFTLTPAWVTTGWAVAVWSALLGSVTFLLRLRVTVILFALGFGAMAVTALYNFVLSTPSMADLVGTGALVFSALIAVVAALEWAYVAYLVRKGVLT